MPTIDDATFQSRDLLYSPTEVLGKECIGCYRVLEYDFFQRDSSYRDGRRDLCDLCASVPRLNTAEHTSRIKESNFNSEAVKRQRWAHQEELRDDTARVGRQMAGNDFLYVLKRLVPNLYITEGNIQGDLAIYKTYGSPQPKLEGRTFEYLFYMPSGVMPEFSQYEFDDERDIAIKEKQRGWRTVLLRLIKSGLLTEEISDKVFGRPEGPASVRWHRTLYEHRNRTI